MTVHDGLSPTEVNHTPIDLLIPRPSLCREKQLRHVLTLVLQVVVAQLQQIALHIVHLSRTIPITSELEDRGRLISECLVMSRGLWFDRWEVGEPTLCLDHLISLQLDRLEVNRALLVLKHLVDPLILLGDVLSQFGLVLALVASTLMLSI